MTPKRWGGRLRGRTSKHRRTETNPSPAGVWERLNVASPEPLKRPLRTDVCLPSGRCLASKERDQVVERLLRLRPTLAVNTACICQRGNSLATLGIAICRSNNPSTSVVRAQSTALQDCPQRSRNWASGRSSPGLSRRPRVSTPSYLCVHRGRLEAMSKARRYEHDFADALHGQVDSQPAWDAEKAIPAHSLRRLGARFARSRS